MQRAAVLLAIVVTCSSIASAQALKPKTTIIWEDSAPGCDVVAVDGYYYRIINRDNLVVAFGAADTGKFMVADLLIVNNSNDRIIVDPEWSAVKTWKSSDRKSGDTASPLPLKKVDGKIKTRVRWANFLRTFSNGFTPNQDAQYQAMRQYAAALDEAANEFTDVGDTLLKSNTLFPGQFILGNIFFQKKAFDGAHFEIQIGDTGYNFGILPSSK